MVTGIARVRVRRHQVPGFDLDVFQQLDHGVRPVQTIHADDVCAEGPQVLERRRDRGAVRQPAFFRARQRADDRAMVEGLLGLQRQGDLVETKESFQDDQIDPAVEQRADLFLERRSAVDAALARLVRRQAERTLPDTARTKRRPVP